MSPRSSTTNSERAIHSGAVETRLSGRWLTLARGLWLALVACAFALFIGSLPTYQTILETPCVGVNWCTMDGALSAQGFQALRAAGVSPSAYAGYTIALDVTVAVIWLAVGLVIFWRRSDDWVALLTALTLAVYNPGQQQFALSALALAHPLWTAPVQVMMFVSEAPIIFFALLFPDGHFAPRFTRWLALVAIIQQAFLLFVPANSPLNANNWPFGISGLLFIAFLAVAIYSQIYRYRILSNATQRQQIKWAVSGLVIYAILLIGLSVAGLIPGFYEPGSATEIALNVLYPLAALPLPISIGIATLRYGLWDIDALINKALVYGLLTAMLAAFYLGLTFGLESLVAAITGQNGQNPVALVVSTLVIASLIQPLRKRVQSVIDRRFYRKKLDASQLLAGFSAMLRNEVNLQDVEEQLVTVTQEIVQPAHISLWLRAPDSAPGERQEAR